MNKAIAVFPLQNTVFFPDTILPLHVFEDRYRELIQYAQDHDESFVVALATEGEPPFERIATQGTIKNLQLLDDGRYLLELHATGRVLLHEVQKDHDFYTAEIVPHPEFPGANPLVWQSGKTELLAAHTMLFREVAEEAGVEPLTLPEHLSATEALHTVASTLPIPPRKRQELLEIDSLEERFEATSALLQETLEHVARYKVWSKITPEGPPN